MRNGNFARCPRALWLCRFLPYLWGMETSVFQVFTFRKLRVLTVPMRNGNQSIVEEMETLLRFLPYLWGMETHFKQHFMCRQKLWVLTVPMRNGNFLCFLSHINHLTCSYRTYEEWKPIMVIKRLVGFWVLTVPMRNGNLTSVSYCAISFFVLTVPMRNGNEKMEVK